MKKTYFQKVQKSIFTLVVVLVLVLLAILGFRENTAVINSREEEPFTMVNAVTRSLTDQGVEFSFPLDMELAHDTELVFYVSHQWVDVWVGEECVYSLCPSGELSFIKTPGSKWIRIPVYQEDAGEDVRVMLTPAYENHLEDELEFYLGSSLAIYRNQLHQAFPAIALSMVNIFVGVLLLFVAIYYRCVKKEESELLPLSMLGITMGFWQLAHNDFSPFLLEGKEIFLYYLSVTMMLVCMIPLVCSAGVRFRKDEKKVLQYYLIGVAVMASIQIVLQMAGILDLREMFPFTHGSIIIGALLLIGTAVFEKIKGYTGEDGNKNAWILAVGALGDLLLYYVRGSSSGLVLILSAVLIYMLLEGLGFLSAYVDQGRIIAEKEKQLVQSRVVTMMSQIRSHFVFNVLNAISGMCKYDPEKADETIVRFARYLRNNIDIMEDDKMIPFDMELRRLEDYIILEQVRFGNKIEFVTDLEETNFMIPPLVLQPIVENSIKHGIMKRKDGGTIMLSTWKENDNIMISIEDDGVGFDMEELKKEKSVGLKNIRFRLHHLVQGILSIKSEPGNGTRVLISYPRKEW